MEARSGVDLTRLEATSPHVGVSWGWVVAPAPRHFAAYRLHVTPDLDASHPIETGPFRRVDRVIVVCDDGKVSDRPFMPVASRDSSPTGRLAWHRRHPWMRRGRDETAYRCLEECIANCRKETIGTTKPLAAAQFATVRVASARNATACAKRSRRLLSTWSNASALARSPSRSRTAS